MILLKEACLAEERYDKSERISERINTLVEEFGKAMPWPISKFTVFGSGFRMIPERLR
jgi:hypothetical protein